MQVFGPNADTVLRAVALAVALLTVTTAVVGARACEPRAITAVDLHIAQPVPFSHAHHVGGLGIDCRYCHTSVEVSDFAGIPDTHTCMTCHSQVWTDAPALEPVRTSYATGRPLRWNRVHELPDYVFFSHRAHVAADVACQSCHGRVDRMPLTRQVHALSMEWCLDCHRAPEVARGDPAEVFAMGRDVARTPPHRELLRGDAIGRTHWLTNCSTCHR